MFASTHPQDFPPAILSRLQRFDVRRLTVPEIEGKLQKILAAESVEAEPAAVHLVARLAAGGMRDAESMLDQLLAASGGHVTEANVRDSSGWPTPTRSRRSWPPWPTATPRRGSPSSTTSRIGAGTSASSSTRPWTSSGPSSPPRSRPKMPPPPHA
jgi:hypothetical protein